MYRMSLSNTKYFKKDKRPTSYKKYPLHFYIKNILAKIESKESMIISDRVKDLETPI